MNFFDSRNVFDRIETSWNLIFSDKWKITLLPLIAGWIIATWIGIYFFYLAFLNIPLSGAAWIDDPVRISLFLANILMAVTIFITWSGLLQTYTFSACEGVSEMNWQDLAKLAWKRLWWWMWYYFWFSMVFAIIIWVSGLCWFLFQDATLAWILAIPLLCFIIWGWVAISLGKPGYILGNSWKLRPFFGGIYLSRWRWWRVFGNTILVVIIIGSALSTVQQFLFYLSGGFEFSISIGVWLANIQDATISSLENPFANISLWEYIRYWLSYTILLILYYGQRIFTYAFQYTVWKETKEEIE